MSEVCKVCKKGYLTPVQYVSRDFIRKEEFNFLDCSNRKCEVHTEFCRKMNQFNGSK